MNILELLETHSHIEVRRNAFTGDEWLRCQCGWLSQGVEGAGAYWEPVKRAHLAEVLEAHQQEREAEALEEAAHDIDQIDIDGDTALWIGPEQEYTLVSDWLRNRATRIKDHP